MRRARPLLACAAGLTLAACFEGERVIRVEADGRGTIEDTLILGRQLRALMTMAARRDGDDPARRKARLDAAAAKMGPGVTAMSEELEGDRLTAVYAFEDVSKIAVDVSPGPEDDSSGSGERRAPLTFRFERHADRSLLTVVQPPPEHPAAEAGAEGEEATVVPAMAQGMWGMMKGMLKGLKLRTRVVVSGELLKTNAHHTEGSAVTVLEMDFDAIGVDRENFERFTRAGAGPASMDPALLQGVAGIKVNPEREISIEFRGR
jgi:hypothetical protein